MLIFSAALQHSPKASLSLLLAVFSSLPLPTADACTALAVSPEATVDGSHTFVSHNDDAGASDFRVAYVPPSGEFGSSEPIYPFVQRYPRYVGYNKGPTYLPDPARNQQPMKPMFDVKFTGREAEKSGLAKFWVEKTYGREEGGGCW